ncbi:MAG: cysteine hydrolase [Reyranella sp.]|nr:cysteine hydrolase [Reyranella sp.]
MPVIAAQPYEYSFPAGKLALIVIDMQRDFVEEGGFGWVLGNDVRPLGAIMPVVRRLLYGFRAARLPIIHRREGHRPDLTDCPPSKRARGRGKLGIGDKGLMGRILIDGESGNDLVPELAALPGETVIVKPGKGAFYTTRLAHLLEMQGIGHLVFQTTMREANDRGYECLLAEDATESYFPEFKAATLAMIRAQGGIVGWTAPTDMIVKALR